MLCHLSNRSLLRLSGEHVWGFLQGIITNDIMLLQAKPAIFAALLNPQGKLLHDFFLTHAPEDMEALWLETHREGLEGLVKLLTMYRLRAKITFTPLPDWHIYARIGDNMRGDNMRNDDVAAVEDVRFKDPRHPDMGERVYSRTSLTDATEDGRTYEAHRLHIGIPDGVKDAIAGRSFPLELGYDKLHAVDFAKGCYVGQEVTARSKFRGTLRKGLYHVRSHATLPAVGTEIIGTGGVSIGEMRSSCDGVGLALVRHEAFAAAAAEGEALQANGMPVVVSPLAWMQ
jgi:hypothetical protein